MKNTQVADLQSPSFLSRNSLPRFYPILDAGYFSISALLLEAAEQLMKGGAGIIQYRNKHDDAAAMLMQARVLRQRLLEVQAAPLPRLIMNDRADLCLAAAFDGVHVGQNDISPESARKIIGTDRWLGVSTHNPDQVMEADKTSADYIAIGPVFGTFSKASPDAMVGLEGVRQARALTRKPLVAIGGITCQNCLSVIEAGADSVAVISALVTDPRKSAEDFLSILE